MKLELSLDGLIDCSGFANLCFTCLMVPLLFNRTNAAPDEFTDPCEAGFVRFEQVR